LNLGVEVVDGPSAPGAHERHAHERWRFEAAAQVGLVAFRADRLKCRLADRRLVSREDGIPLGLRLRLRRCNG
jgi:hypothetical protein